MALINKKTNLTRELKTHKPIPSIVSSMERLRRASALSMVGWASLGCLAMLGIGFICPSVISNSSALNGSGYNEAAWQPSEPSSISLNLDAMLELDITPSSTGNVSTSTARLRISTSSNAGYKIYLGTEDKTNAMTNTNNQTTASIAALSIPTAASGFAANTWGYALTDSTVNASTIYNPMPVTSSLSYDTTALSGEHYLTFAAKIDTSLPAGQYANTVTISAVANPALITGMMELSYMQDMTSSICAATIGRDGNLAKDSAGSYIITPGNEPTKQLIDIRDGKEYWVSKLADGNCWMTQNLALDLTKGKTLTSSDTDLNSKTSWIIPVTTETVAPATSSANVNSDTVRSWDLGEHVLATPLVAGNGCLALTTPSACPAVQDVRGWQPTFVAQNGVWNGQSTVTVMVNMEGVKEPMLVTADQTNQIYDAHYLLGNYYQWRTVTAESGTSTVISPDSSRADMNALVDAADSICPKGWRLPTSGNNYLSTSVAYGNPFDRQKSFYRLLLAYQYPKAAEYEVNRNGNGAVALLNQNFANGASQNPARSPLYFVRSGIIPVWDEGNAALTKGGLSYVGGYMNYWSSTAFINNQFAWEFWAYIAQAIPSSMGYRFTGKTARCVAR